MKEFLFAHRDANLAASRRLLGGALKRRTLAGAAIMALAISTPVHAASGEVSPPPQTQAAANVTIEQAFDALVADAKTQIMSDPALAVETALRAEELARSVSGLENSQSALATALWLKGEALLRSGRPEEGAEPVAEALQLVSVDATQKKLRADLLLAQGRIAGRAADMELAVKSYFRAHDLFVELGETRNEAVTLMAIGSINRDAESYDKALGYYERAAEIYAGDARVNLSSANNRANILKELGRHDEARLLFQSALLIARDMGSGVLQGRILTNMAENEVLANNFSLAQDLSERARTAFGQDDGTDWLRFVAAVEAQVQLARNDIDAAEALIEEVFAGVDIATTSLSFEEAHDTAQQIYARLDDFEKAYAHQERFQALTAEATRASASANLALLEAQFHFAEQELNIARLRTEQIESALALGEADRRATALQGVLAVAAAALIFLLALAFGYRRHRNQVARMNTTLESTVVQRDTEIAQRKTVETELVTARQLAEQANEAKSAFLATMSHELRTPMNGILGFADVLHAEDLTQDQLRYVDIIKSSGNALLTLINDILNLSQIEAGKLKLQSKLFNLRDTVIDATTLLQAKAKEKNLHLATHIDPNLPANVTGDPDRIRQVLINLVGNAVKFTDQGSVAVIVVPDEDGGIKFSVVDTGCGIAEDKTDILFERFSQVDNSSTREFDGSGLGLAICKELVRLMDGEIGVKSQPGVGSEFFVTLPLTSSEELEVTAASVENRLARTARVLVVDNVSVNQQIYRLIMPSMNAETVVVDSADAALAAIDQGQQQNAPFDLVIVSDIFAADAARDLPQAIRERMSGDVKVVLSSPRTYDPSALAKMGFDARIEQPISARTIFSRFAALLPDNVSVEYRPMQRSVAPEAQLEVSSALGHVFTQSGKRAAG